MNDTMVPLIDSSSGPKPTDKIVAEALHSVRTMLRMQVAFVSEFQKGLRIFRHIDSQADFTPIQVGSSSPLEESFCQRVVDGRLPELIRDARKEPEALKLPVTTELPVGAHLSIPIRLSNGSVYGTFCCFSTYPDSTLNTRDLNVMKLFADFVGKILERELAEEAVKDEVKTRLRAMMDEQKFTVVFQPIFDIETNTLVGHEALTRFLAEPLRSPDLWFIEASQVGMQEELELTVIRKALEGLAHFPEDTYLSLNVSPETILKGSIGMFLARQPLDRLMLEVTEHASVNDYALIAAKLEPLRKQGLKLAVDDAGAGFASFRHILKLKPDVIKLDSSLIRTIDSDVGYRALAAALIRFAEETGSSVIAEGVETDAELQTLRELKVSKVQGYLLGRPQPLDACLSR